MLCEGPKWVKNNTFVDVWSVGYGIRNLIKGLKTFGLDFLINLKRKFKVIQYPPHPLFSSRQILSLQSRKLKPTFVAFPRPLLPASSGIRFLFLNLCGRAWRMIWFLFAIWKLNPHKPDSLFLPSFCRKCYKSSIRHGGSRNLPGGWGSRHISACLCTL